jgi:hypothetical protein
MYWWAGELHLLFVPLHTHSLLKGTFEDDSFTT